MTETRLPYQLTPVQQGEWPARILELLRQYRGKERAITADTIAQILGDYSKNAGRKVRVVIRQLIEEGHPIAASCSSNSYGFFWIETPAEAQEYLNVLRSRGREVFGRYRDFARAAERHFSIPYQPMLFDPLK